MKLFSLLAAVLTFFLGACKKTNAGGGSAEQTLQQYFSGAATYTLFNHALQRTHLDTLLGGTNPYTVFAVSDSAMSQAGYTTAGIDAADIGVLTGIVRYHLVPGAFASTAIDLYQETPLTTADSSYPAYMEYNNFGLFYNGIRLVSIDNQFINGIVQRIQTIARPPLGDLVTTIARIPTLSDFSYIVSDAVNVYNAGGSYNSVVPFISGSPTAPITVFLPDNNYFISRGEDSYTAILQAYGNGDALMTAGIYFTSDFQGENAVPEYNGTQETGNQMWFSQNGYSFNSVNVGGLGTTIEQLYHIVQANIVTTNGIIQVVEPVN